LRDYVEQVSRYGTGLVAVLLSYVLWGLVPLFWRLVDRVGEVEILAHRVVWSLAFLLLVLALTAGFRWIRTLSPRTLWQLGAAGVLVTVNWGVFIYAVTSDHIVDSALGYYINPLVSVALGVLVLHERLRPRQRWAVALGTLAVLVMTVEYGQPPWIALTLAGTFGVYGLVKKRIGVDGTQSLTVETALLMPLALAYLVALEAGGDGAFLTEGAGFALLLAAGGVVTALPLMLFGIAAIRVPLSTIGLMQYIAPTMHFIIGVGIYGEDMPPGRVAGFVIVWVALVLLTVDALGALRPRVAGARPIARVRPATPPET